MDIRKVKKAVAKISEDYGVKDLFCVERQGRNKIEIRTELPSYAGGNELSREVEKIEPGWICENQGGCVYILYRPL